MRRTLSDKGVAAIKPRAARYAYADPELRGHYVRVQPSGAKSFVAVTLNPNGNLWKHRGGLTSRACLEVSSIPLDKAINDRAVNSVTPVTIELALAALTSLEERDREIGAQWRSPIERARYEVDLAERRYEAVDPGNRLIAATLEQRWNEAMQRLHDIEADKAAFEQQTRRAITSKRKQQITCSSSQAT